MSQVTLPIDADPDKLSGQICFAGTRVPIDYLFNHIALGGNVDSFVEDYDSVSREQAVAVARMAERSIMDPRHIDHAHEHVVAEDSECTTAAVPFESVQTAGIAG